MNLFQFTPLTTTPAELDIASAAIGDDTQQASSDFDIGKAVKLGDEQNYILCTAGDEIEGFINTVSPQTVNDGYSFGGIQRRKRIMAEVGANQGGTAMAVLDYVVADDQVAFGTKGVAQVKTGTPTSYLWRVLRVDGDGTTGTAVLLERQ